MSDERPAPSEVEPLSPDETAYQRDADGELIPETRVIETSEGWRRVKITPTPKGETMEYERRFGDRDDLDLEEVDEILNDKIVDPDIDWSDDDIKPGVYVPVLNATMESIMGEAPSNQFHADVREELEKRQGAAGN